MATGHYKRKPLTAEHKKNIGLAHLGMKRSAEARANISKGLLGHTVSDETRKNMSIARLGKKRAPHTEATKLKMSLAAKGRPKSAEHCAAISASKLANPIRYWAGKKRPDVTGPKNWKWIADRTAVLEKHRIRGSVEWKNWRASVFARDDFTCKECGVRGVYLEPHHIVPIRSDWDKLFDTNNGITLCRPCHQATVWREEEFADKYTALLTA